MDSFKRARVPSHERRESGRRRGTGEEGDKFGK